MIAVRMAEMVMTATVGIRCRQESDPGSRVQPRRRRCAAGLEPLDFGPYRDFAHRVDASIRRDIVVALKP
jgi:hypothetical protein